MTGARAPLTGQAVASTLQTRRVLLIGELPLADELARLCTDAGSLVSVYLVEETLGADGLERIRRDAAVAGIAIEAMSESIEIKRSIVAVLDAALPPDVLLLTSALSTTATQAGGWTRHPARVIGFGALPPLAKSSAIELAPGLHSDTRALDLTREFFTSLDLAVEIVKDSVGLVLPRIVCGLVNEAAIALSDGVASVKDIDLAMRLGTNYPRGPLEWGDLIGLDVVLSVLRGLQEEIGYDRYQPASILKQYVRAGRLGKKTGRGFYEYGDE